MKVVIQVIYTEDWQPLADVVLPNLKEYCERHSYELKVYKEEVYDHFSKLKKIQERFQLLTGCLVVSMDLDCLITNHQNKFEDFVGKAYTIYLTEDLNGINGGVFMVKMGDFAKNLVELAIRHQGRVGVHCEQDAFTQIDEAFPNFIAKLKHPSINSYLYELYPEFGKKKHEEGQWQEGDFILHLPAITQEKRIEIFKNTTIVK